MPVPDPGTGVDRWSIDFLFADQDAIPTFVECKRCADTRARREIVGHMLEYAANGHHYWTRDGLREVATQTAAVSGSTLDDAFRRLAPTDELSIDDYFDLLQQNLREGQLRIVFFLEDSSPELRSVVDFLNPQMERSEVLLVEARQYSHGGSRIVVPTLFGYTEEARLVKVTVTTHKRRKPWNETSFFADAAGKLTPNSWKPSSRCWTTAFPLDARSPGARESKEDLSMSKIPSSAHALFSPAIRMAISPSTSSGSMAVSLLFMRRGN